MAASTKRFDRSKHKVGYWVYYHKFKASDIIPNEPPTPEKIVDLNDRFSWYSNMLADVSMHGVENPVITWYDNKQLLCVHGNSRLWAAQQVGCVVPCFVCSREELDFERIEDTNQFHSKFKTPPAWYELKERGLAYGKMTNLHQERQWHK